MNPHVRRDVAGDHLRGALWVLPSASVVLFLLAGALLSRVTIAADSPLSVLAFQGTAEDARQVLIVVSATMITVTGLVFALTIVALQIAAGQYSPRLLRNFMRDRGTQVVLSIFVGSFAYSTAGLHTVGTRASGEAFVPGLAVTGSLALGLATVVVLVYFIHHLAHSIQIDTIMSAVERETRHVIHQVYPDPLRAGQADEYGPDVPAGAVALTSPHSGYIQTVRPGPLTAAATHHDLVVRLARMVGDHVVAGTTLAWAWPRLPGAAPPDPAVLRQPLRHAVQLGFERTMLEDVPFGLRRLVDIANRALSPAINDPYTAVQAVHHLTVLLCLLAPRQLGDWLCRDARGSVRLAVPSPRFEDYLRLGTAQIRRSGAGEPALARALLGLLRDVGGAAATAERRGAVARHVALVLDDATRETAQRADVEAVLADGDAVLRALEADLGRQPAERAG